MPSLQNAPIQPPKLPGRLYSFVVLALATIVVCITTAALLSSPKAEVSAETTTVPVVQTTESMEQGDSSNVSERTVSNRHLAYFLVASIFVGLVGMIPSRAKESSKPEETVDAKALAAVAGLKLLGSVFTKDAPVSIAGKRQKANWLSGIVFLCELVLCVAVVTSIYGCFAAKGISSVFVRNPFEAYALCVTQLAQAVAGLVASK